MRRFSNLALVSVGCLIATGVYAMTLHTTRGTILNTSYGQTLLIKHALILPLIGTAALNLLLIKPRLRSVERARRWLPRLLWIEAGLGLAVLLVTATLTQLPPAHLLTGANAAAYDPRLNDAVAVAPPTTINADADVSSGPQAAEMQDAAGMTVVLLTSTGKDGSALDANIVDPNTSQPLADVQRVTALITFSDADLGQTSVLLTKDASGHYRATGIFFPIKGVWNIQLVIRRANIAEDARLNFSFTSDPARFQTTERPGSTVTSARTGFLWPRLLPNAWFGLLLALVGVALLAITYRARSRRGVAGTHAHGLSHLERRRAAARPDRLRLQLDRPHADDRHPQSAAERHRDARAGAATLRPELRHLPRHLRQGGRPVRGKPQPAPRRSHRQPPDYAHRRRPLLVGQPRHRRHRHALLLRHPHRSGHLVHHPLRPLPARHGRHDS